MSCSVRVPRQSGRSSYRSRSANPRAKVPKTDSCRSSTRNRPSRRCAKSAPRWANTNSRCTERGVCSSPASTCSATRSGTAAGKRHGSGVGVGRQGPIGSGPDRGAGAAVPTTDRGTASTVRAGDRHSLSCGGRLVVAARAVPDVELDRLDGELHQAGRGKEAEDQLQGVVLGDAGVDGLLAAEAGGELQGLAAVLAEGAEGAHQEVAVGDRLAALERSVPGGEHREVVLVELGDRLRVVDLELGVGDLVDPGAHRLAEELATGLAADRIGYGADRVAWIYEAEGHEVIRNLEGVVDGKIARGGRRF